MMRQLYIALGLMVVFLIGCYYLVTQTLHLDRFYPPSYIPMAQHLQPPLPSSPRPGPPLLAPGTTPKPSASPKLPTKGAGHAGAPALHLATPPPLLPAAMTPIPAPIPSYAAVTPPPA